MANLSQIRSTIESTQSTGKITEAMRLVAASKLGKSQQRMRDTRPYAEHIHQVIGHLANSHSEYHHPYMQTPTTIKRVGLLVVSTDRGLCGGLNANLFRHLARKMQDWQANEVSVTAALIGNKAMSFFRQTNCNIVAHTNHLGDNPTVMQIVGVVKALLDEFDAGKLDAIYLASNRFESVMKQTPTLTQLLPVVPAEDKTKESYWDYLYEPEPKALLDLLLNRYLESLAFKAVIENIACEQAARMLAMQNATDNGKAIIDELRLAYNKARQAKITTELTEIVSGADAVS